MHVCLEFVADVVDIDCSKSQLRINQKQPLMFSFLFGSVDTFKAEIHKFIVIIGRIIIYYAGCKNMTILCGI